MTSNLQRVDSIFKMVGDISKWIVITSIVSMIALVIYHTSLFYSKVGQITKGMTEEQVEQIMTKQPDDVFHQLTYCPNWTGDCKSALNSGATTFSNWHHGIDTELVVGFNENRKVVFVGTGDI